ncbi:MAG: hypothetical protein Q8L47_00115 [bacterium]|nr:hypothetical protein [bacterium]
MKIKSKKLKKENIRRSPEHSFGVLLENVESQLKVVAEGHEILAQSIHNLREETRDGFRRHDLKFDVITDELRLMRNAINAKVDREEFLVLEKRVIALERSKSRK